MKPDIPKQDPSIVAAQKLADEEANQSRISSATQRASDDQDRLFAIYGARAALRAPTPVA